VDAIGMSADVNVDAIVTNTRSEHASGGCNPRVSQSLLIALVIVNSVML
jgi:hypothetical protein